MKKRFKPSRKQRPNRYGPSKYGTGEYGPDEQGAIVKHGKKLIKTALVYPNTYKAGMSSLGFQTVYRLANQNKAIACERVFLPDHGQKIRKVKSLETGLHLDRFDIIMFSISFENDFINIVRLMKETGIPLGSSNRGHIHPLVIAGGVACFLNPEPVAPFMDLFLLGEAECLLDPFFKEFQKTKDKAALLTTIEADLPGAYVPANHLPFLYATEANTQTPSSLPPTNDPPSKEYSQDKIQVQYLNTLEQVKTTTTIMTSNTAFKKTFLIETLKGCPHGCRFCTAGFIYRPPRIYPLKTLYQAIDEAGQKTDKIGLVSSAVLDHPGIQAICRYARDQNLKISFSSLRADKLSDQIIQTLADSGVKTATIAPEAGSQRMRDIINKKITGREITHAVKRLVNKGIINLKLYFMIGLPFENDQDVQDIVSLTLAIKEVFLEASRKKKKIGTITLSINPFIPKPCTPFQWCAMALEADLKRRVAIIQQGLKKTANIKLNFESLREAKRNALFSLGDRYASNVIEAAAQYGWTRAMKMNKKYCDRVMYQEKSISTATCDAPPLPWDILEHRINDEFLAKEFEKAGQKKKSPACPMKECSACQICINA